MDFNEYQTKALKSDQVPAHKYGEHIVEKIVPLLGLAGEAGELLSEYKKHLRDGPAHRLFKERVADELGDTLWYLSNIASKFELDLNSIAEKNLIKVEERFAPRTPGGTYRFDEAFPNGERLPRTFEIEIKAVDGDRVQCFFEGNPVGNELSDNSHDPDGYRFHDVFHFGYAAVLGWSPVTRKILERKRKSDAKIDEVEDGGRASAIEEGISALVFSYAKEHNFWAGVSELDYELLKNIRFLTGGLEAKTCSIGDWERAILAGYEV
jgi:NTP pyrophosphatase (non-canonical NTP hydrolase)